jgi:hypothetical protein
MTLLSNIIKDVRDKSPGGGGGKDRHGTLVVNAQCYKPEYRIPDEAIFKFT